MLTSMGPNPWFRSRRAERLAPPEFAFARRFRSLCDSKSAPRRFKSMSWMLVALPVDGCSSTDRQCPPASAVGLSDIGFAQRTVVAVFDNSAGNIAELDISVLGDTHQVGHRAVLREFESFH